MKIAVTGGSGKIGSAVVRELVSRGHEVINIDRRPPGEAGKPAGNAGRFVYAHLGNRAEVQPILEQVEAVCHLGEIPSANVPMSPEEVFFENTRAASVVLQTATDLKLKRVIYTSSCQVYGMWNNEVTVPRRLPFDETQPATPQNAYSVGKMAGEAYARLTAEKYGMSVAVFRPAWVIAGEYSVEWEEPMRKPPTATDGFATYLHVSDMARAYALAIEKPRPGFEVYHFTAAEVLSLQPIAGRLAAHQPSYPPLPVDWPAFKSPVLTEKAREHFGWEPKWNFLDQYRARHGEPGIA